MTPPEGTLEGWAWDYLHTTSLADKLSPPPQPASDCFELVAPVRRVMAPVRPAELTVVDRALRTRSLATTEQRAKLFHTFLHHEVQAAELMAWAFLAFPDAPVDFRRGLLRVCADEIRHAGMYQQHLATLGTHYGCHPVRDWFWLRVPQSPTPAHFVAVMGVGFEGANLDHALRYAEALRAVGDVAGATLQDQIREDEVAHVAFAHRWLAHWGVMDFAGWAAHLPAPLSPWVMRGRTLNHHDRALAGLDAHFLTALERWNVPAPGS